jgi:hypothetical protein
MLQNFSFYPRTLLILPLVFAGVSGCNALPFLRFGHHRSHANAPQVDPINTVPIDTDGSCGKIATDRTALAIRPLSNFEYDLTIKELLSTTSSPSNSFPPDATGTGFDTGAAHTLTTGLAQSYLDASQTLAEAYVDRQGVVCSDQGFAATCTGDALASFAERAFRRPLLAEEATRLRGLPLQFASDGLGGKDAYSASIASVLLAPQFLYRSKLSSTAGIANSDQYALASKLSYALWASMPDDQLLNLARDGRLRDRDVLASEINRMIVSPKSEGFLRNFTSQWLGTNGLAQAPAASHLDADLVTSFSEETFAYVNDFLRQNLNMRNLLDARFTYVNAQLIKHYGLLVNSSESLSRVELSGTQRGGLLTQGAFLMQTSNPDGTSPVKRGKWVLDRILCAAPPPAPAGMQTVLAPTNGKAVPMRQRLAAHRATTACASCHKSMDPIGLAFENYDMAGKWRDNDDYGAIDASGTLPSGEAFADAAALAQVLKVDPGFPICLATKLAKYGLGREPNKQEQCLINKIAARAEDESYGLKNMLVDLSRALLAN